MSKYRIKQMLPEVHPDRFMYHLQKRILWAFWYTVNLSDSIETLQSIRDKLVRQE